MADKRFIGNILTNNPNEPANDYEETVASGVWTLSQAFSYRKADLWPTSGNIYADQVEYTDAGTYTWTCPQGVHYVSAVCIGGGGGGMHGNYGTPHGGCGG